MVDDVFIGLHVAEHHRGSGLESDAVGLFADIKPLAGGGFTRGDDPANRFGKNFGAPAGYGSNSVLPQCLQHIGHGTFLLTGHENDLRRAEWMDVYLRAGAANGSNVGPPVFQSDFWIMAPLEQHRGGSLGGGVFHFFRNLLRAEQIRVCIVVFSAEGTKGTAGHTDIGVIGVGVDHKGDRTSWKSPDPLLMRQIHQLTHR